ncbi:response regulator [Paenibacillus sp. VCA1]|uniref:response regulator n=1 Tax=Paenibacillus sp. VCA1 TaxID=3039148 RepID=UPI00287288D6|nr:response regulator [Paenibacillus sp. VCA1]MDR9852572.1 response regulator [Paenibacillus sp. VCA1]
MIEILLVDDESYVTESIKATIPWSDLGVEKVYQADSAEAALAVLREQSIDIVVSDIRMPETDGLELIERILREWPHIRCMVLTGYSDFDYAKKALRLQAFDYILKPVDDEEFIRSLSSAIEALKDEWEAAERYHKLVYTIKSDSAVLKASLMHDLVLGRTWSQRTVADKLAQYEIRIPVDEHAVLLMMQLGEQFAHYDHHSMSLMEYAVGNIAEEVFAESFAVWACKAPHDGLVMLASLQPSLRESIERLPDFEAQRRRRLHELAESFRGQVSRYLKGDIRIVISDWFRFPDGIAQAYRAGLGSIMMSGGDEAGAVMYLEDLQAGHVHPVQSIESLYKPPTLIHLLESKQWDSAQSKVDEVFEDLRNTNYSREHLYEVYLLMTNAFMYMAHKQGQFAYQIDQSGFDLMHDQSMILSLDKLKGWAGAMLEKLRTELSASDRYARSYIIHQVQELISKDLGQDTSVKTIADKVFLHPVYLSKIYKAETGESLGDYIIRMRMERALYLLKKTNKKIYEITAELGYQNPQYFSKMFKKHYGLNPNEFRDQ